MSSFLSLVIPAYNEELLLPALLESARACGWRPGDPAVEVIVANNGSTDGTATVARSAGATVIDVAARGIGIARNAGAAAATGAILGFVDADSRLHPDTITAIGEAMSRPGVCGGATGVTVERWSAPLRILAAMTLPIRCLGIDSGVVFCRRADFADLGGYRGDLLVGEDVEFLLRLRRHARYRRQRLVRLRHVETCTSTRKFDRHGHWRFLGVMAGLAVRRLVSRRSFAATARRYWYEDR